MTRTEIIQKLINLHKFSTYLEIGDQHGICFNSIVCKNKTGVDPNPLCESGDIPKITSDEFFAVNYNKYDLISIDGLHHSEQVIKDIENSLNSLTENGIIVLHDCLPPSNESQQVPRIIPIPGVWTGDVWRAFVYYRRRSDLFMATFNTDYGVGIIKRGIQKPLVIDNPTYDEFVLNKYEWLNLIDCGLKKVLISGVGRSGTSFLVALLTELGLDTGIPCNYDDLINVNSRAGLEYSINNEHYILKNPNFSLQIPEINNIVDIDMIYIPFRNMYECANSRKKNGQNNSGGLWLTDNKDEQYDKLCYAFGKLMSDVLFYKVPHTLIDFREMIDSPEYLFNQLSFVLREIKYEDFLSAYIKITPLFRRG